MSQNNIEAILATGSAYINYCVVATKTTYHAHNFVEIAYVAGGRGTHIVNGVEYQISGGDIFLINFDIPHKFVPSGEPLLIYNCIFTPAYFNAALGQSRNFFDVTDHFLLNNLYANFPTDYIFATAHASENSHVMSIYERMLYEFKTRQIGYRDIMRGYIIELLVIICRSKLNVSSCKTQRMIESLEYINAHFREAIQSETLADLAGFSASHFRRLFKSLTGKTPIHYIRILRIEEACRLLKSTDSSVEQIAREIGYSDLKHFYTVFKKITGKRPKDFR